MLPQKRPFEFYRQLFHLMLVIVTCRLSIYLSPSGMGPRLLSLSLSLALSLWRAYSHSLSLALSLSFFLSLSLYLFLSRSTLVHIYFLDAATLSRPTCVVNTNTLVYTLSPSLAIGRARTRSFALSLLVSLSHLHALSNPFFLSLSLSLSLTQHRFVKNRSRRVLCCSHSCSFSHYYYSLSQCLAPSLLISLIHTGVQGFHKNMCSMFMLSVCCCVSHTLSLSVCL